MLQLCPGLPFTAESSYFGSSDSGKAEREMRATLNQLAADLATGKTTSSQLIEQSLARIADAAGEGARAFVKVHADKARTAAKAADALRKAGLSPSRFAGIPIAVKDLFDLEGEATPAGSKVLANAAPAKADATPIARL